MKNKHLITAILAALFSLFLIWTPFLLKLKTFWGIDFSGRTMSTIVANFDGINFLVVAKTLYNPKIIEVNYASILSGRENLYFSAHYPLFPLVVKAFDMFLTGPNALLAAIVLSNILLSAALFWFFKLVSTKNNVALYLTLIALFIPARMLSMRGVGSNESLFIFFVLTSLIASVKGKHWLSAILGSLGVMTRSPGILLLGAYMMPVVIDLWRKRQVAWKTYIPYLLIPLSLVSLWLYYGITFGDFLAYFKVGGNINLYFPPFLVFGSHFDWVSGMWLEDILYTYVFYATGIILFINNLVKNRKELKVVGYFGIIYLTMLFFIVHRDISRYALPIAPLAIAGFSPYLNSKYVKYGLAILLIPIFLYSFNFIINNVQPVMDWSAFL